MNNCYYHQDLHYSSVLRGLHNAFNPKSTSPYIAVDFHCKMRIRRRLQRNPFSGLVHSAGELLHTPKRISTSMTTALLFQWTNTFYGIRWASFLPFTALLGASLIASSAYQKWPTKKQNSKLNSLTKLSFLIYLKFENRSTRNISPIPLIIRFTRSNLTLLAILRETSEETSY